MPDAESPPSKKYYSISEVSEMLDVKPHVLRYWESQFPVLRPRKNRAGNRMYQEKDLDVVRSIQEMLHQRGYTIAGARRRIGREVRKKQSEVVPQIDLDFLSPAHHKELRQIRDELVALRDMLARSDPARRGGARSGRSDPP